MKKILILISLFIGISISAQFNSNAPWMQELEEKTAQKEFTMKEISEAFNAYWEKNKEDINKKGSGYKPFKRWENRWSSSVNENGKIKTPTQIWTAWEEKNTLQARGINDVSDWQNIGPFTQDSKSGQGRVNTFIVDPNDANTYYVGAPAGGIWKSIDAGVSWEPLSDYLPQIGVSGIAIDPNNSNIIYIATGDDDAGDSYSIGVLKSIDAGLTWNTTGLQFNNSFSDSNEIYIHPGNSNILWVATSNGVYKTIDAGVNWTLKLNGSIRDLKINPLNPNVLYAVTSSRFYKSTDGGENFIQISNGLPSSSSRLAIEVTPANSNIVYVLSASGGFQGLYKSTNSGDSFTQTNENSDIFGSTQAWYDMALTVSDTNANIVFVGVLNIWKSTDGGDDFTKINDWFSPGGASYTHADIHFMRYFDGELFAGTDGGIYKSTNDGASFNELNEGLSISQYYRIAVSKQSAANISGGLQDNGGFALSNDTWYNYHGGDGMDCAVDPNNPNKYYGFTQYGGSLNVTINGGETGQGVVGSPETGNWITPLVMTSQSDVYAGFSHLYKLDARNNTWTQISGDVFGGKLNHIEFDPTNELTVFVSKNNRLYKSTFGGLTFSQVYTATGNISSIEVNNEDANIVYLTTSSSVLKSTDGGTNFTNITNNLPSDSKLIIKHQPHSAINDLYVGTSLGVYHTNDNMTTWEVFSTNLPNVPVRDLDINIIDKVIIAGTYGRGVWQSAITVTPPDDDIRLVAINEPTKFSCDSSISPQVLVKNEGNNVITQVTINYTIDTNNLTYIHNGTINSDATETISLPIINGLSVGEHDLSIETTISNDTYSDNNTNYTSFYINSTTNSPSTINVFNSSTDAWLVAVSSLWQIGNPTTPLLSGSNATGYVTSPASNYSDKTSSYLVSPCYDLTSVINPIVKFDLAFDIEEDWDVLYLEYSVDEGENWTVLGTPNDPNWYNNSYTANQLTIGTQWSGTDTNFREYSHTLSEVTNEVSVFFRFAFLTDDLVNGEGAIIDNFVIEGTVASIEDTLLNKINIYPNPSIGEFTIQRNSNELMQIKVMDITGKSIFVNKNIADADYHLDLSHFEKGIYFAVITIDNKKITKKLILK